MWPLFSCPILCQECLKVKYIVRRWLWDKECVSDYVRGIGERVSKRGWVIIQTLWIKQGKEEERKKQEPVSVYAAKNYLILFSIVSYQHSRLT